MFTQKLRLCFRRMFVPAIVMILMAGLFTPGQAGQLVPLYLQHQDSAVTYNVDQQDISFHLEVFALASDERTVWHRWNVNDVWSDWYPLEKLLPCTAMSPVKAISWGVGRTDLFVLCGEDPVNLYHTWYDANDGVGWGHDWGDWGNPGVSLVDDLSPASKSEGSLDVFAIGADEKIYRINYVAGGLSWGLFRDEKACWSIAAAWISDHELELIYNEDLIGLARRRWDTHNNTWTSYSIPQPFGTSPGASSGAWAPDLVYVPYREEAYLDIFMAKFSYGQIWQSTLYLDGTGRGPRLVSDLHQRAGRIFTAAAVSPQEGQIDIFGLDVNGVLYRKTIINNKVPDLWEYFSIDLLLNDGIRFIGAPDAISWTSPRP